MALSDKNIVITPNVGQSAEPKIVFSGASSTLGPQNITLNVLPDNNGTLSFEGSAGQLFSITNDLTGIIFSVNDASGIPSIEVNADGTIKFAEFGGTIYAGGSILPNLNNPTDSGSTLGSAARKWNTVYATTFSGTATTALYADLAENYVADKTYEPGTVLIFGGSEEVTESTKDSDTAVVGVVSDNPAYLMNAGLQNGIVVPLALTGRVPCKVVGKANPGDLLVSSNFPGIARASSNPILGSVIGKIIKAKFTEEVELVEVLVGKV